MQTRLIAVTLCAAALMGCDGSPSIQESGTLDRSRPMAEMPKTPSEPRENVTRLDAGEIAPDASEADGGFAPDASEADGGFAPDAQTPDSGVYADADVQAPDGGVHADADADVQAPDGGVHEDAQTPDSGVHADAQTPDSGVHADAQVPDSGVHADAQTPDSGVHADTQTPDSGVHADMQTPDGGLAPDGGYDLDSGFADATGPDAGFAPDAYIVDAGTIPANVFAHPQYGILATAPVGTNIVQWSAPSWSRESIASTKFISPMGNDYTLLVYEKQAAETFTSWMRRAEVGDAALSSQLIQTLSGESGFAYEKNDFGEQPDVHITINGSRFVYYFHADVGTTNVTTEFVQFVQSLHVQ